MTRRVLVLVRHAKSSWKDATLADRERPLSARGREDARRMAKRLERRGLEPELIVSSPARRALHTARIFAKRLHYRRARIAIEERLYEATWRELVALIHDLDRKCRCVLLFGHNPEFTQLAHRWSAAMAHLPTCAVARFEFKARHWSKVAKARLAKASVALPSRGQDTT